MLHYVRESAPLMVAAIAVPGALLLTGPWISSHAARLDTPPAVGPSTTVPSSDAASVTPRADPIAHPSSQHHDPSPARAAIAAAAALSALAVGTALTSRVTGGT
jgi:hypothetical protein